MGNNDTVLIPFEREGTFRRKARMARSLNTGYVLIPFEREGTFRLYVIAHLKDMVVDGF